jgi:hypothetical protein
MENKPISQEEWDSLAVNLIVSEIGKNDCRNIDLNLTTLKAIEIAFEKKNSEGVMYGPRAFEEWLKQHLLNRNKRPLVLLAELAEDGSPAMKRLAKVVLKERYGMDETVEIARRAMYISLAAMAVSAVLAAFEIWKAICR